MDMSRSKVLDYRARFAARWSRFLRETYATPEDVAAAFGVRFQTALNWWQGENAPSGAFVGLAFAMHPGAAPALLGAR
jgi:hypothetical protein